MWKWFLRVMCRKNPLLVFHLSNNDQHIFKIRPSLPLVRNTSFTIYHDGIRTRVCPCYFTVFPWSKLSLSTPVWQTPGYYRFIVSHDTWQGESSCLVLRLWVYLNYWLAFGSPVWLLESVCQIPWKFFLAYSLEF